MRIARPTRSALCALSLATAFTTGCGLFQSESKKNSSTERYDDQAAIDTQILGSPQVIQGSAFVQYGATPNNAAAQFQCKIDVLATNGSQGSNNSPWQDCLAQGTTVPVTEGSTVVFRVKAIIDGVADTTPAEIVLNGQADEDTSTQARTVISNKVETINNGSYRFDFRTEGGSYSAEEVSYECQVSGQSTFTPCPEGDSYEFSGLQNGKRYRLVVRAVLQSTGDILGSDSVQFEVTRPEGLTSLNIGPYYFQIPTGMHLTQYSNTNGLSGGLPDVYRLAQGQDPYYLGIYPGAFYQNDGCSAYKNDILNITAPSGRDYSYCHSTIDLNGFYDIFGFRFARNHFEVSSDVEEIQDGRHRIFLMQYFDNGDEFSIHTGRNERALNRSRFDALCGPSNNIRSMVSVFQNQVTFPGFWAEQYHNGNIWVCDTYVNGLNGENGFWKVAATVIFDNGMQIRDEQWRDCDCSFERTRVVEIVYMEKAGYTNFRDSQFARNFQEMLLRSMGTAHPF